MAEIQEILVVLDPGAEQHPALDKAARLAGGAGARLRLFCCDHDARLVARLFLSPDSLSAARADFLRRRLNWLETRAEPLRQRGLAVDVEAVWDSPLHAGILTEVGLCRPDLVVKDTAWHPPLRRGLLTSADWHLVHTCPVPLLLVKSDPWPASPRIGAAVDPGHPGDPAGVLDRTILREAAALAARIGGIVSVVHAYLPVDPAVQAAVAGGMPASVEPAAAAEAMRAAATAAVDQLLASHPDAFGDARLLEGSAVDVLPAWCEQQAASVLVVGAMSRSRLYEAVLGSTAERLLDRIPSDLLVVRARPA